MENILHSIGCLQAAPPYVQGGPRIILTLKKIIIYNNLKFYIYLPLKNFFGTTLNFFMPIKLNFGL